MPANTFTFDSLNTEILLLEGWRFGDIGDGKPRIFSEREQLDPRNKDVFFFNEVPDGYDHRPSGRVPDYTSVLDLAVLLLRGERAKFDHQPGGEVEVTIYLDRTLIKKFQFTHRKFAVAICAAILYRSSGTKPKVSD